MMNKSSVFFIDHPRFQGDMRIYSNFQGVGPVEGQWDFPKESDFVLHSAWFNFSLLPNYLSFSLSRQIGVWAPLARLVEVYGSQLEDNLLPEYQGIYVLVEKIKRDKNRVDLEKLGPEDLQEPEISGGYLIKNDKETPGEVSFLTPGGTKILFDYPKSEKVTPGQRAYLEKYFSDFENSTKNYDPLKPEAIGNVDGLKYSSYFHKIPRVETLLFEPYFIQNESDHRSSNSRGEIATARIFSHVHL